MRKLLQYLSWGHVSKGGQVTRTVYRAGIFAQSHGLGTIEEREVCGGRDRCIRLGLGQVELGTLPYTEAYSSGEGPGWYQFDRHRHTSGS